MIYRLTTPLASVRGIGPKLAAAFAAQRKETVRDLLLFLPLRYEDRSTKKKIAELVPNELVTIEAVVTAQGRNFYKGPRSIQSATVGDDSGKVKLMWFNNPHIISRLEKGSQVRISGKLNDRGTIMQPIVEDVNADNIHTGRLVPVYSIIPNVPGTVVRKFLKTILDELAPIEDTLWSSGVLSGQDTLTLRDALRLIHFPDTEQSVVIARERFAIEELLALIAKSHQLKSAWEAHKDGVSIPDGAAVYEQLRSTLPFALTPAQARCTTEILRDLEHVVPMNRLLIGDVGSGKTAVAGFAAAATLEIGKHAVLIAPTNVLAEQHAATFTKIFPSLRTQLVTARKAFVAATEPTLFIGTHALFTKLTMIQPALLIYDEQHRFGVDQRSLAQQLQPRPHILTLSATPIPRSFMLTIFAHLQLSVIDEMPPGRKEIQTWITPEKKRADAYAWIGKHLKNAQCLIVCPFIDQSEEEGFAHIASANEMFGQVSKMFSAQPEIVVGLLHGRMSKTEQQKITDQLYANQIQVLVTTPIVEVGVDLPAASIIIIEAAERFGLASLHQMRGRVGRAGQEAFCFLFTNAKNPETKQRLEQFCKTHNGMQLAEQDLHRRGAGDIFGTQQHGFDELQFASWSNFSLITKAKQISEQIEQRKLSWQPFFTIKQVDSTEIPFAN